jgi:hypothetical protein
MDEKDADKAAEAFMVLMVDEGVSPMDMDLMIDKIIQRIEKKKNAK